MKLLFVGDVMGKPGRRVLAEQLPRLIDRHRIDYSIVNIENAAGGFGVTESVFAEFERLPIDCYSTGNHVWDKREVRGILEREPRLLRPANYPDTNPGRGLYVGRSAAGVPVATLNLEGQALMGTLDSPFTAADRLLAELDPEVKVILVDFHAEATSEKQAMGFFLDGRVSAVFGTHTHVPTGDERVLPQGTAFITDVGMTGPYESVIGMRHDKVVERFLRKTHVPFEVAKRDVRLAGAVVDVDETTGRARTVERLLIPRDS
ncbi:MAG: TIGR00282 family metallophosphoesterase [Acidobacteriota bacterium]